MPPTSRSTWKARERQIATMFGTVRQRCSGSSGLEHETRSDSRHPRLFLESKLRQSHATRTLWDETKELAKKEGKVPVVILSDKGRPGSLICVHSDDFAAVAIEYFLANFSEMHAKLDAAVNARDAAAYVASQTEAPPWD